MTPNALEEVIQQHLIQGNPVEKYMLIDNNHVVQASSGTEDPHHHQHDHHHHQHDHHHEERVLIEQKAIDIEGPPTSLEQLAEAILRLCVKKNYATNLEIQEKLEYWDRIGVSSIGPDIVARAWTCPLFKEKLFSNPNDTITALGYTCMEKLVVVENTKDVHNVIVCTLCSCYPRSILGRPPLWYKSRSYRSRVAFEPRKVLEEFGVNIPENVKVQVHDSTADMRYLVIPMQPEETKDWPREKLMEIITRDSMIGTSVIVIPK
eukprot:TRINITY_DN7075_c0_g1_i4.p2 TRINITY_DN7075_c0_g1~~TRINITY_DN7075_c0_g1_i4.p2  ORF type:complete len:263 (-),score=59.81 TRINITY_DN7075_c0_g1_i4:207-995(-)